MGVMSMDLRERVARALGTGSSRVVVERFAVSASWVRKLWNRARTTGSLLPGGRGHPPRKVDAEGERMIRQWVISQPDMTIDEVRERYLTECRVSVSEPAMRRTLRRLGLSRKKRRSSPPNAKAKRTSPCAMPTSHAGSVGRDGA
jgi:transposase